MGADSCHQHYTRAGYGGAPPPDDLGCEISRPTAAGRARIGSANAAAATTLGRLILSFSGHFRLTHTLLPPFLNPLNSFLWSLFSYSLSFERYDKNEVGQRLDRVFQPPQQPLDQGEGTDVFLVSWAFHLYVVCKFWMSFG